MSFAPILDALALPSDSRVDRRVPKNLLMEQGAPTAADKRKIQEGIEETIWIAALKPTNIGVPAFRDEAREYLEIVVLTVTLRETAKDARLIELLHRAIPYPVALIVGQGTGVSLALAHKRRSQGEAGKVVIEEMRRTAPFDPASASPQLTLFLPTLAVSCLPHRDLFALYQGWIDRVAAFEAARITGAYAPPESAERATELQEGLEAHNRLAREIAALRAQASKEKQINRRVELNLEIKRLEARLAETREVLSIS